MEEQRLTAKVEGSKYESRSESDVRRRVGHVKMADVRT